MDFYWEARILKNHFLIFFDKFPEDPRGFGGNWKPYSFCFRNVTLQKSTENDDRDPTLLGCPRKLGSMISKWVITSL